MVESVIEVKINKINIKMKNKLLIVFLCSLLFHTITFGQCSDNNMPDKCVSALGTFNYIKSFSVNVRSRKNNSSEFSYVFSKGSVYVLIACNEDIVGGRMIMSLYDRDHNFIASTYNENEDKYVQSLLYPCSSTGIYYIKTTFQNAKKGCGTCILGFTIDKTSEEKQSN
jgi:hypothetical protein